MKPQEPFTRREIATGLGLTIFGITAGNTIGEKIKNYVGQKREATRLRKNAERQVNLPDPPKSLSPENQKTLADIKERLILLQTDLDELGGQINQLEKLLKNPLNHPKCLKQLKTYEDKIQLTTQVTSKLFFQNSERLASITENFHPPYEMDVNLLKAWSALLQKAQISISMGLIIYHGRILEDISQIKRNTHPRA